MRFLRSIAAAIFAAASFAVICISAASAADDRRVALVIGNSNYSEVPELANPVNDATAMSEALKKLGFDTTLITNVTKNEFEAKLGEFGEKAADSDLALVFYAGHGMEMDGQNYLIPTDAKLKTDRNVRLETVSLDNVLATIDDARKLKIVLLDACRDNPFAVKMKRAIGKRAIGRGLAEIEVEPNVLVSYAAAPGQQASDGDGGHSPYTEALLAHIATPGMEINKLFRTVASAVRRKTNGEQIPYETGRLPEEDFYFNAASNGQQSLTADQTAAAFDWERIKDSRSKAVLKAFIEKYSGDAIYRTMAEEQLALLVKPENPVTTTRDAAPEMPCDRLAASSSDRERIASVTGVSYDDLDAGAAISACEEALAKYPEEPRFLFQLGRAEDKRGNYKAALGWYEKAAKFDHRLAIANIGVLYHYGQGVAQNYDQAIAYYRRAADAGDAIAMANLALLYERGEGVKMDLKEALVWYRKAAAEGDAIAMNQIGIFYERSLGVPQDFKEAVSWFRKSAERGEPKAMKNLAELYRTGLGVPKDEVEARRWEKKAKAAQ
jgi:TPR repeat protein/uncharacterized caspase-like protein